MAIAGQRSARANSFRTQSENAKMEAKGTKPTREPSSVLEVFLMMVIHVCKKSIFFDTNLKIALYLAALFLLSLIADVINFPRSYFSRSDNVFNQYFVKIGWFWTLALAVPYVVMTAYTNCCGRRPRMIKGHLTRLAIATVFWYAWTSLFNYIETNYGRCHVKAFDNKRECLKNGHFWNGFDISGHCFILIYSSLVLIEEARAIIGWESIRDHIRDEEYTRSIDDRSPSINPLKKLPSDELAVLKKSYEKFTPYVRGLFIAMTLLQILWDVMLVCSMIYYHIMVEKFISGVIAILTWFITYRVWYTIPTLFPSLPGEGVFKYNKDKMPPPMPTARKRGSLPNGKHFMGMPLYGAKSSSANESDDVVDDAR